MLSIVSGILIGTSYIPLPPWASLFCFAPLWYALLKLSEKNELKKIFFAGWIAQFTVTLIGFNWIALTAHDFGRMPWPVAALVLLSFCAIANLDIPIAGITWAYLNKKLKLTPKQSLSILAVVTAIYESWVPTIFPWNHGYTWLWAEMPIAHNAEVIGFQGLSSIIILLNLGFLISLLAYKGHIHFLPNIKHPRFSFLVSIFIFICLNFSGYVLKRTIPKPDAEASVLITQANIGNLEKEYLEQGYGFREHIFDKYAKLTRDFEKLQKIDFMVWPETAYPYDLDQRRWSNPPQNPYYVPAARRLIDFSKEMDAHLITGGYGTSPNDNKVTNTFFVVEKTGNIQPHPYYKTILLAFGEYIPFADTFPSLKKIIPAGDFSRGFGPKVTTLLLNNNQDVRIGAQICYESLFPSFTRGLADQGAQIIVNLTNDSWYGTWQEPYQHLYMTLGRAIEYRLPLIRSTNTGISTVVLASGEVLKKSPTRSEWVGEFKIPYNTRPSATLYQLYPWLMDSLLLLVLVMNLLRGYRWKN
jgi:apolipoprotein N-acyltransferase